MKCLRVLKSPNRDFKFCIPFRQAPIGHKKMGRSIFTWYKTNPIRTIFDLQVVNVLIRIFLGAIVLRSVRRAFNGECGFLMSWMLPFRGRFGDYEPMDGHG